MKKTHKLIAAVLLCLALVLLTACGDGETEEITAARTEAPVTAAPAQTSETEDTDADITPGGREGDIVGTWISEDESVTLEFDGVDSFKFSYGGIAGIGVYTYDGVALVCYAADGDGEVTSYYGTLESDGTVVVDDLGGVFLPESAFESDYDLLGTWIWEDGEGSGRFTFTEDWIQFSYTTVDDMGMGSAFYTEIDGGVMLDELDLAQFGDGAFYFTDADTLMSDSGVVLIREAAADEIKLDGTAWDNDDEEISICFENGRFRMGDYNDEVTGTYTYAGLDILFEADDGSSADGTFDTDGSLYVAGIDGSFYATEICGYMD